MEIAVVGIPGAGKTTFIEKAIAYLEESGFSAAHIDAPILNKLNRLRWLAGFTAKLRYISAKYSFAALLFSTPLVLLLYFVARRENRDKRLVFIEQHPAICCVPLARLYSKRLIKLPAKILARFIKKPEFIFLFMIDPVLAQTRVSTRQNGSIWSYQIKPLSHRYFGYLVDEMERSRIDYEVFSSPEQALEFLKTDILRRTGP